MTGDATSADGMERMRDTYAGPMPPEVSEKAVEEAVFHVTQAADHYGWTDAELEGEMREIAEYIKKVCRTQGDRDV